MDNHIDLLTNKYFFSIKVRKLVLKKKYALIFEGKKIRPVFLSDLD